MAQNYTIRRYHKITELSALWQALYSGNTRLSPFQSYEFCEALVQDYRYSRQRVFLKPEFYAVFRDGEPRLIAPLWRKSARDYYLIPDFMITPYRDLIYPADCAGEDFLQTFLLLRQILGNATLYLRRINERSALFPWLAARCLPQNPQPCVRIEFAQGHDAWYRSLSKNTRQNLRTAENRLARAGAAAILRLDAGVYFTAPIWDEVLRVHRKRYALRDGMRVGPLTSWVRRHHDPLESMQRHSAGNFLARLYINGGLAAFFSGLTTNSGREISVCRLSIDDDYDAFSPGALLLSRSIRQLSLEGRIHTLDLCYGGQPYKYRMGGIESLDYDFALPLSSIMS